MNHCETDDAEFPARAYAVKRYGGIAFHVYGWATEPTEDTEWDGYEQRTGKVVAVMVGDDHRYEVDPEDLTPLEEGAFCGVCGQVGCGHQA